MGQSQMDSIGLGVHRGLQNDIENLLQVRYTHIHIYNSNDLKCFFFCVVFISFYTGYVCST